MKNILIIIVSFLSMSVKSQYTVHGVKLNMYSDVWVMNGNEIRPHSGQFGFKYKHIEDSIDIDKVRKYLLESYNQFRADYGMKPVIEDLSMSKSANEYAKFLSGKQLIHSNYKAGKYLECLGPLNLILLSHLNPKNVDINKVIADCYFDLFVVCPGHMSFLIDPNITTAGFGIYQNRAEFMVCIRTK